MDKILFLMVIAGNPQIIMPMDSANDCKNAVKAVQLVHEKMMWCGRGGCSGKDVEAVCWDQKENKQLDLAEPKTEPKQP